MPAPPSARTTPGHAGSTCPGSPQPTRRQRTPKPRQSHRPALTPTRSSRPARAARRGGTAPDFEPSQRPIGRQYTRMGVTMPQPPAFVVERISEGHQPGQLPARLGRAPVLGDAIAGLATRVLPDHASSVAIMQRGEPGADTEITRAPWRAGRPAVRRLLPRRARPARALVPGPDTSRPGSAAGPARRRVLASA